MDETQQHLADRYGRPRVTRRTARVLTAVAAVVFVVVVVIVGLGVASPGIRTEMLAYDHLAEDVIAVDFVVTMDPGTEASCQVQALNEGRAQVGFVEVTVPAQPEQRSTHHVEIATQGDAVSAEVLGCTPL